MASSHLIDRDRNDSLDSQLTAYSAAAEAELAIDAERAKRPDRPIVAYSAAAAGAGLLAAQSAEAAIQYTSVNWTIQSSTRPIDFDAGGSDFKIRHDAFGSVRLAYVKYISGGATTYSVAVTGDYARRFAADDNISGAGTWDSSSGRLFRYYSAGPTTEGYFQPGQVGYVGVRFNSGAGMKYGWIHVDVVAAGFTSIHVDGYAYQDDGSSIKAGEMPPVPEPSTIALALLASGAAGVMRSRRKKILKGRK